MTVPAVDLEDRVHVESSPVTDENDISQSIPLPSWVERQRPTWGEQLLVPEWQQGFDRIKNGWQGRDLIHDKDSPVQVLDYFVNYGPGLLGLQKGGVGTTLTGVVHFTKRAESHQGYCHGGSMTSLLDDVVGWVAFLVTGSSRPWSGFTVQINSSLRRPIPVDSVLVVRAHIIKVERRKVFVNASIFDPAAEDGSCVHAEGDGMVIINRGVLPEEPQSS
jgi:acyl-coenzyme A thioesterase PaaI-like protein